MKKNATHLMRTKQWTFKQQIIQLSGEFCFFFWEHLHFVATHFHATFLLVMHYDFAFGFTFNCIYWKIYHIHGFKSHSHLSTPFRKLQTLSGSNASSDRFSLKNTNECDFKPKISFDFCLQSLVNCFDFGLLELILIHLNII